MEFEMDDFEEKDRKEIRKEHLSYRQKNKSFIDEDTKFANKAKKARKYRLEELEEEELYEEWGDYLR